MQAQDYERFIREVYLEPLRSVLIVDDDYPTLEELIAGPVENPVDGKAAVRTPAKRWRDKRAEVKAVIRGFHRAKPPLIVDVHDGQNVTLEGEEQTIEHLHQSDLLVLDFELDQTAKGDGSRAIEILRTVFANQQFNLVALHTNEDLPRVFREVLFGLLGPENTFLQQGEAERYKAWLEKREEETEDYGLQDALGSTLQREHYIHFRLHRAWVKAEAAPSLAKFEEFCRVNSVKNTNLRRALLHKALELLEVQLKPAMAQSTPGSIEWSDIAPRWIRCDEGFIAFTEKGVGVALTDEILKALVAWRPAPSRLFWGKLRAELDSAGFAAESKALASERVLATWYRRLFGREDAARDFVVAESVSRHSEMLISEILPAVRQFAGRLVEADDGEDPLILCKQYFNVDLGDKATNELASSEHNVFVCSKPYEGYHLTTGHIFKLDGMYWVCLTPMCDLVPSRDKYSIVGDAMPFIAVRLKDEDASRPSKQISSGRVAMIKDGDAIKTLMMGQESESSNPEWFTLYAANQGRFEGDKLRLYRFGETKAPKGEDAVVERGSTDGQLIVEVVEAELVTQLRYEYALSMMHKLGGALTRVGLDFLART